MQLKLALQHELVTSQLRVAQAKALVEDLTAHGATQSHTLNADSAGVISQITAQQGQRLPAASPFLQWFEQNQWGVFFGVEPEWHLLKLFRMPIFFHIRPCFLPCF
jgi:multidrug resistance efflux pump